MAKTTFNQESNRVEYGYLLKPEIDYHLDFALGMTYSLDLETFLGVPISLGMFDSMDTSHQQNPFYLLEAIRKSSDRIALLCNPGQIKVPSKALPIFALLENSIFEVKLGLKRNFSS